MADLIRTRLEVRIVLLLLSVLTGLLSLAACSSADDPPRGTGSQLNPVATDSLAALARAPEAVGASSGSGIHVRGAGVAIGIPDVAVVTMGVEVIRENVADARGEAARLINQILDVLDSAGVANNDIETTRFSIDPRYEYTREGGRILVGYEVTNTIATTIRSLPEIGAIIDKSVAAGGDASRVFGVRFEVENSHGLEQEARLLALQNALEKADLYATQLGVDRGDLYFVTEDVRPQFPREARLDSAVALQETDAIGLTQLVAGDFEVRVDVRTVFAIR